jgi:hypothetical protein
MDKKKIPRPDSFRKQMAQSMAELDSIIRAKQDFTGNGWVPHRFSVGA